MLQTFGIEESLVGVGIVLLLVLAALAFFLPIVVFEHRKEMALIAAGEYAKSRRESRNWILAAGLLLVAVGVGQAVESFLANDPQIGGVTTALVGVAALTYYFLKHREDGEVTDDQPATHRG